MSRTADVLVRPRGDEPAGGPQGANSRMPAWRSGPDTTSQLGIAGVGKS
jgi:hypothetical protein